MIKKYLIMVLFLSLSLFLIIPVSALEPPSFEKTTDIYPGDLDYRNSLIDWNGYNLEFDIIKDMAGGLDPTTFALQLYVLSSFQFSASTWVKLFPSDPQDFQYILVLTETQKTQIKNILFNRTSENMDGNHVRFVIRNETGVFTPFAVYFRIEMKSLLNIDFRSVYIADSLQQDQAGQLNNFNKGIMFRDTLGNVIQNVTIDDSNTQPIGNNTYATQRALYNFTNKYTNIKYIDLVYLISANSFDPRPRIQYMLNEIGLFADSQVILPDLDVDTDFQIYEPTICASFDFGCVARNLIGEFSNNIYKRLGAENIASGVMGIYDTIFYPVYIINNVAWQNGILSIYAIVSLGVLYLIVKRVLQ